MATSSAPTFAAITVTASGAPTRPWVAALRGFAAASRLARCELCGQAIDLVHDHLLETPVRRTLCACSACAARAEVGTGDLRRIPAEARLLDDFRMSDGEWDAMAIPIGLAFFYASAREGRVVAMYPGPAGAVESLLDLAAWSALVEANPVLSTLRPDVEALLVNRVGAARQYFQAPIDRCFALAGLMRMQWHGLSGGAAVWESIDRFLVDLAAGRPLVHAVHGHA